MLPFWMLQSSFLFCLVLTTALLLWPRARVGAIFFFAALTWFAGVSTVRYAFQMRGPLWEAAPLRKFAFKRENGQKALRVGASDHHKILSPEEPRRFPSELDTFARPLDLGARFTLAPSGNVSNVHIIQSSGDTRIDNAVVRTLRTWQFGAVPDGQSSAERETVDLTLRNNYQVTRVSNIFWGFVVAVPVLWWIAVFIAPPGPVGTRDRVKRLHLATGLLACIGWLLIYRLAPDQQKFQTAQKQQLFLLAGFVILAVYPWLVSIFRRLRERNAVLGAQFARLTLGGWLWALLGILLLVLTIASPLGTDLGTEAKLWIRLPGLGETFQTIELVKLLFVGFVAARASLITSRIRTRSVDGAVVVNRITATRRLMVFLLGFGLLFGVLAAMKDFGPVLLLFIFLVTTLSLVQEKRLARTLTAALVLLLVTMYAIGIPYRWHSRVDIWRDPWTITQVDAKPRMEKGRERPSQTPGGKEQVANALWAIGSGGLVGMGWGQGKPQRIEAVESDFALAALAEEIGWLGATCVLILMAYITVSLTTLARFVDPLQKLAREDAYEKTLLLGGAILLGGQTLLIVAGNLRLFPLTGVTFPFISYGGASLLMSFLLVGLLTGTVSRVTEQPDPFPDYVHVDENIPVLRKAILALAGIALVMLTALQIAPSMARNQVVRNLTIPEMALQNPRLNADGKPTSGYLMPGSIFDRTGKIALVFPTPRGRDQNDRYMSSSLSLVYGGEDGYRDRGRTYAFPTVVKALNLALNGQHQGKAAFGDSVNIWGGPRKGYNVSLTIDTRLQRLAEEQLENCTGAVVGIVPGTGEVLFAAGRTADGFGGNWHQIGYAPGSTFKTLILATGLETDTLRMGTSFVCNGDYQGIHDYNDGSHGPLNALHALEKSCNSYYGQAAVRIGWTNITDLATKAGFDRPISLIPDDLISNGFTVAAIPSQFHNERSGSGERILARTGIGQVDVRMTPLHLALWTATVANRGILIPPTIVRSISTMEGKEVWSHQPTSGQRVFSEETGTKLATAMESVVRNGTGKPVQIRGMQIAGKTGTAQKESGRGRITGKDALFIAFAPAESPRIAIAVLVENGASGGKSAAPIARRMIEAVMENDKLAH